MTVPVTGLGSALGMHVVAIQALGPPRGDDWVRTRSQEVGVSFYELRARLRVLDGWPGVLATYAGMQPAQTIATGLSRDGIDAWIVSGERTPPRVQVRSFSLVEGVLRIEARDGCSLEIPTSDVRMLVVGIRLSEHREFGAVVSPVSRAALWMAPNFGVAHPKLLVRPAREPFIELHARGRPIVSFRAASLHYSALGGAVAPTRAANFQRVVETLRAGCPRAIYDERLRGRVQQVRMLGPTLRPEKHLWVALALVTRRAPGPSPYR